MPFVKIENAEMSDNNSTVLFKTENVTRVFVHHQQGNDKVVVQTTDGNGFSFETPVADSIIRRFEAAG